MTAIELSEPASAPPPDLPPSVTGRRWALAPFDPLLAESLRRQFGVPGAVARLMAQRGITLEKAEAFLNPSLKRDLPDPSTLLDMEKAAKRLADAVVNGEQVCIFGDYDVDGGTSTALLLRFFKECGLAAEYYIPDRMTEGYGPNAQAMEKIKQRGTRVIVTVDCGAVAFEPLAHAKALGMDVIVADHHIGASELPEAFAVVNPNRLDETTPHRNLAAVGVCFLLAVAINRELKQRGWFLNRNNHGGADLMPLLDLVALGTVCDVMTLKGLNRTFVAQGLRVMAHRRNLGLKTLAEVAGIAESCAVYHLGFVLGPRINAGGRIGESDLGVRLLTTEDPAEARTIAERLDRLNQERQAIERHTLEEALAQAESLSPETSFLVVSDSAPGNSAWHAGVIGIVASRIKDRLDKPTAVIAFEEKDGKRIGKASVRSVPGVDAGTLVANAKAEGLILSGGGHAMAAGFSVEEDRLEALKEFLHRACADNVALYHANRASYADLLLSPASVTLELLETLSRLAPFGTGHPEPRILLKDCLIVSVQPVGENHLMAIVTETGPFRDKVSLKAMAFRAADTELGRRLLSARGKPLWLAGKAKENRWNGAVKAEFHIDDVIFI